MIPSGIKVIKRKATAPQTITRKRFCFRGEASWFKKAARKNGMYVVTKTGIAPHQG
jgi:hypothetical protein